jgi:tRNA pseudouridine synthase 10
MAVLEKAFEMLSKYPLCDHCLGRQFALLGYSMENNIRGSALKVSLTLQATALATEKNLDGVKQLKILATNGFSREAQETLLHLKKRLPKKKFEETCFLCEGKFQLVDSLIEKSLSVIANYEYTTFLVGIELPVKVEEREDEFKAALNVGYGESIRHEFGRLFGKGLAQRAGKEVDYLKPDLVVVINPFSQHVRVQVNPLFVAGRYRKLVRDIPQSKWFCSSCRGKGCEKCGGTGKMYPE